MTGWHRICRFWRSQPPLSQVFIVLALLLVVVAYLPTLQFDYVTQDQWRAFRYPSHAQSFLERVQQCTTLVNDFYIQTGRPLVWLTECLEHGFVEEIADFQVLRPVSLIVVCATLLYLAFVLSKLTGSLVSSLVIAGSFVLSAGYSFMYLQGWLALMVLISVLLAAASFDELCRHELERFVPVSPLRYTGLIGSASLFLFGCLIYPAWVFLVIVLALIQCLLTVERREHDFLRALIRLGYTLVFYGLLSIVYYGFVKLCQMISADHDFGRYAVEAQGSLATIVDRVWRIIDYLCRMKVLGFEVPYGFSLGMIAVMSVKLSYRHTTLNVHHNYGVIAAKAVVLCVVIVGCLLVSVIPWLLSSMDTLSTRHVVPVTLFLGFVVVWLVQRCVVAPLSRHFHNAQYFVFGAILLVISFVKSQQSFLEIVSTRSEIELLRVKLKQWYTVDNWRNHRFILIIVPSTSRPLGVESLISAEGAGSDDAVLYTSRGLAPLVWQPTAILREMGATGFHLVDCGFDTQSCVASALLAKNSVVVAFATGLETITAPVVPYIINMSQLTSLPVEPSIDIQASASVSATSRLDDYGPEGLFLSVPPGWHAQKAPSYPQILTIDFNTTRSFQILSLLPQELSLLDRLPKRIALEVSDDGEQWITVGEFDDLCDKVEPDGWVRIAMPSPVTTRHMRINIWENCGHPDLLTLKGLNVE